MCKERELVDMIIDETVRNLNFFIEENNLKEFMKKTYDKRIEVRSELIKNYATEQLLNLKGGALKNLIAEVNAKQKSGYKSSGVLALLETDSILGSIKGASSGYLKNKKFNEKGNYEIEKGFVSLIKKIKEIYMKDKIDLLDKINSIITICNEKKFNQAWINKYIYIYFKGIFPESHTLDSKQKKLEQLLSEESVTKLQNNFLWEKENYLIYILVLIAEKLEYGIALPDLGEKIMLMKKYEDLLEKEKNIILHGAPGTGKSHIAKKIATKVVTNHNSEEKTESMPLNERIGFVQFHPSYDYTDFVEGLRPVNKSGTIGFEYKKGIFREFVDIAIDDKENKYVFIIDEINRGEISKILGELFFSIDPGYRGEKGGVLTQYSNMIEDGKHKKFYIPENVYIIGTMNDIDRSVDTFDFAMRRRFTFIEVTAEESAENMNLSEELKTIMNSLNNEIISQNVGLSKDYQIGASYFKVINDGIKNKKGEQVIRPYEELENDDKKLQIEELWKNKLEPLLKDYLRGEFDIQKKLKVLNDKLMKAFECKNDKNQEFHDNIEG